MAPPTLPVRRATFRIEEPWALPAGCERVPLLRATDGGRPRLQTAIAVFADDECLNVLFQCEDDGIVATHLRHDAPLYEEDVVEIFLAPDDPAVYFEIEVNPLGTTFDARIESPHGSRATMRTDLGWECAGLFAAVRATPQSLDTIVRIPFASLGRPRPAQGERWRGNFFRIDRSPAHGDEYSAWQPALRKPADFHVPAAFGALQFDW
jgi:cellulose/xylan binding protein with CBM9 domain